MICACYSCNQAFDITDDDPSFYDKVSPVFAGVKCPIPPPTHCPDCRAQRRLAWRVERCFYERKCDLCRRDIISVYSADKSFPVYCASCWWSDRWDPLSYGKEYDFSRSFLDQFAELESAVPRLTLMNDNGVSSENCEYTQDFAFGKNCYLVTGSWNVRDSYYCDSINQNCSDVADCVSLFESQLAYECVHSLRLYHCSFLVQSEDCHDCMFGVDLKGCSDCFGCFGLRQKKFHIFNEPHSESAYRAKMARFDFGSYPAMEKMKVTFFDWVKIFPRKDMHLKNCENCVGDNLANCRNCFSCFDLHQADGCKYFVRCDGAEFCYDIHQSGHPQWCLEGMTPDNSYMTHFSLWCWKCKYVLYSDNCHSCEHCFGCTGLKHAKYCILNKQYTKEEYENLVPRIVEQMKQPLHRFAELPQGSVLNETSEHLSTPFLGEGGRRPEGVLWGEFLPMSSSPFCYNETLAQQYFPLTKEEVQSRGLRWKDDDVRQFKPQTYTLPDGVGDAPDSVTKELLACASCGKNYRIIPAELSFYRKMVLPIPRKCFLCRQDDRVSRMNPRRLFERTCGKCGKGIVTTYPAESLYVVYCEECYLAEVY